jgi:exosome complex RNA-binding protein Rrp42 (RNase PH superfamily)
VSAVLCVVSTSRRNFPTPLLAGASARSGALVRADLGLEAYRSAWALTLELLCLSDGGNLLDCALAAATATLRAVRLPATALDERGVVSVLDQRP